MDQLPFELDFMHKYNLHKRLGLLFDDDDLRSIARVYGIKLKALKKLEGAFQRNISELTEELRRRVSIKPPAAPYVVAAIGDSITSDRESYVKILNRVWERDDGRSIIDCAVSGDTTYDVINRFYSTVLNQTFDWAILFLGTNDCRELDDDAHISNISLDEYKRNMSYFTENLLKRNKKVIHVTIPSVDNRRFQKFFVDTNWIYNNKRIDRTNQFIRQLSKRHGTELADLAKKLEAYEGDIFGPDGIHVNKHAHLILCELLLQILP